MLSTSDDDVVSRRKFCIIIAMQAHLLQVWACLPRALWDGEEDVQ